jgi:hypothetical protein
MRKQVLPFFLLLTSLAFGQQTHQAITSTECASFKNISNSISRMGIVVWGKWTGTLQPQAGIQGQTPQPVLVFWGGKGQSAIVTGGTPGALYIANVPASAIFSVCGNTVTSGVADVYIEQLPQLEKNQ